MNLLIWSGVGQIHEFVLFVKDKRRSALSEDLLKVMKDAQLERDGRSYGFSNKRCFQGGIEIYNSRSVEHYFSYGGGDLLNFELELGSFIEDALDLLTSLCLELVEEELAFSIATERGHAFQLPHN